MKQPTPKHIAIIAAIVILLLLTSSPHLLQNEPDTKTTEYEAKQKIVETQNIGTQFGMPTVVTEEQQKQTINQNKELATKIKTDFQINNTHDLYIKIKQFNQITITNKTDTKYHFKIADGQSCTIHTHTGYYDTTTDTVKITNTTTENVPC